MAVVNLNETRVDLGDVAEAGIHFPEPTPRVPYYRAGQWEMGERRRLFNFVVPMYPAKWLTMGTVSEYMRKQEMERLSARPATARQP